MFVKCLLANISMLPVSVIMGLFALLHSIVLEEVIGKILEFKTKQLNPPLLLLAADLNPFGSGAHPHSCGK